MKSAHKVTHVIYDMDGLLLDTEPFYTTATQIIAQRYGKVFDWSVKSRMIGKRASDSARLLVESLGLPMKPEEYLEARKEILDELFPRAEPMPGAARLTRHLHDRGIPQGVASSSDRHNFELKTSRHTEWFSIFECIVIGDDPEVQRGKPAPDIFLVAAGRLKASPRECLVFEDAPAGAEAGLAAGMSVIAVPDPNMSREAYPAAVQILQSLSEFDPESWGLPPL
jgi:pseudouridine-5'-monophosphatase